MMENISRTLGRLFRAGSSNLGLSGFRFTAAARTVEKAMLPLARHQNISGLGQIEQKLCQMGGAVLLQQREGELLPKIRVGGLINAPERSVRTRQGGALKAPEAAGGLGEVSGVDQISTFKRKKAKIKRERKATVRKRLMKKSQRKREKLNL